jgi:beta-galactosidase
MKLHQVEAEKTENNTGPIEVKEEQGQLVVTTGSSSVVIDKKTGNINQLTSGGKNLFSTPLRMSFFRAETDSDKGVLILAFDLKPKNTKWRKMSLDEMVKAKSFIISKGTDNVTVECAYKLAGTLHRSYTIHGNGRIVVKNAITPKKEMPKLGMQVELPKAFRSFTWFGMGPHDTYWGRSKSGKVDIHTKDAADDLDLYVKPQEHGIKMDVRWLTLTDSAGNGIRVEARDCLLNTSIWPHTLKDLDVAKHIHELPERDTVTLNIDYLQKGLGDVMIKTPKKYRLLPSTKYEYSFVIEPIEKK